MGPGEANQCPGCRTALTGEPACPVCGIELHGPDALRLRDLLARVAAMDEEWRQLSQRRRAAVDEIERIRYSFVGARYRRGAPAAPARPRAEWNVERIRTWLLGLGVALLTASALTFTVVAWARLGPAGRAALLVGGTALACGFGVALRDKLPATAQALTALGIALALVDWRALQVAGVAPGVSDAAWWSAGTAVVGLFAFALGRVTSRELGRAATSILLPTSAVLCAVVGAGALWSFALGMAALAAVLVAADSALAGRVDDRVTSGILHVEAVAAWIAAVASVLVATSEPERFIQSVVPAAVMLSCSAAPMLATVLARRRRAWLSPPVTAALAIAPGIGTGLVLASTVVGVPGMLTLAVVLGAAAAVAAGTLREPWYRGALGAGGAAILPGTVLALFGGGVTATVGPLAWLGDAWAGSRDALAGNAVEGPRTVGDFAAGWTSVGALVAAAAAAAGLAFFPEERRRGLGRSELAATAATLGVVACCLAPVAGGGTVLTAFGVTVAVATAAVVTSVEVERRHAAWTPWVVVLAGLAALPATGWAATTSGSSVIGLAVLVVVTGTAAVAAPSPRLRTLYAAVSGVAAVALVGVTLAAAAVDRGAIGFAMAVSAGSVILAGALARRDRPDGLALELAGAGALAASVGVAADSTAWLAGTLTATVGLLAPGTLRHERGAVYGLGAMAAALGATWAWLVVAGVHVVEAYTLPAAAVALGAGAVARRTSRASSWWTLGPAIVVALGPTLTLALMDGDIVRVVAVGTAAFAVVVVGAVRRLQAPLVLGTITLLALAVDTFGPAAARLPRWAMLAAAGTMLLYLGSTFERRRENVRRALGRFSGYA